MLHTNVFRRVQQVCVLSAFLCVPLLFSTQTRDQFEIPKLIALSLWSIPLVIGRLFDAARRRPTTLEGFFFLFVLIQAVTSLPGLSIAWRTSLIGEYENFGGVTTTLAFAAWFYGLGKGFSVPDLRRVGFFAVTAGYLSALYALAQSLGFDFVAWNPDTYNASRVFAGLGNPNFLSAYLAMALPLHLSLAASRETVGVERVSPSNLSALVVGLALLLSATGQGAARLGFSTEGNGLLWIPGAMGLLLVGFALSHPFFRRGTFAAWSGSLLLGIGLVLTGSRGGWLGALAGLAAYALLRRPSTPSLVEPKTPLDRRTWLRSTKVWATALLVVSLLLIGHPFFTRLLQSTAHPMESLGRSRLTSWVPAVKMLRGHPWKGIGPDCFKIAFPLYSAFDFNTNDGLFVSSRTAHDEWLQAAATSGIPGLLSLALLVGCFFVFAARRLKDASPGTRLWWIAVLSSGVAYLVQNLFSFGVASLLLLWTFLLASVNRPAAFEEPKGPRAGQWVTALLFSAFLAIPITLRLTADLHFARGMRVLDYLRSSSQNLDEDKKRTFALYSLEQTQRAADLFPLDVKYRLYSGMALEQLAESPAEDRKERLQEALGVYRLLSSQSPYNGYYSNDRGRVLTALARLDPSRLSEAEQAQRQAAELSPENPYFLAQWGALLLLQNNATEAAAPLAKAFKLDPTLSAKTLCQTAMDSLLGGQKEGGWRLLDAAVALDPKSADAWFFRGYFLKREGKMKEAQIAMAKALELNPELAGMQQAAK